jgi:hypothetical protein
MITTINEFKHFLNEGKKTNKEYKKDVEAYKFFVVNLSGKKVESGWEFKNDAKEALTDYDGDKNYKVVTEKELDKLGIKNPKAKWTSESVRHGVFPTFLVNVNTHAITYGEESNDLAQEAFNDNSDPNYIGFCSSWSRMVCEAMSRKVVEMLKAGVPREQILDELFEEWY